MDKRTVSKQKPSLTGPQSRSAARQQRDLKAFELHLAGLSVRAVCEEVGLRSTQSGWAAIERGRQFALKNGVDIEQRRIEIDQIFKRTLVIGMETLEEQHQKGRCRYWVEDDGSKRMERMAGVDPRLIAEMTRGSQRWAEFNQLMDRAPEVNAQTTLIQLSAPTDGASFSDRWSGGGEQPVEVKGEPVVDELPAGGQQLELKAS